MLRSSLRISRKSLYIFARSFLTKSRNVLLPDFKESKRSFASLLFKERFKTGFSNGLFAF